MPPGFAALPALIGKDSIEKSIIKLVRQTYYYEALNVVTKEELNHSILFGFQHFDNPLVYLKCVDLETEIESDIHILRYFRLHPEADEEVNLYLNSAAGNIRNDFLKVEV